MYVKQINISILIYFAETSQNVEVMNKERINIFWNLSRRKYWKLNF